MSTKGNGFDLDVKIDTSVLDKIQKDLVVAANKHVRIGWVDKKTYPAKGKNRGITVAQVASWMEFGTKHIYPRPSLSMTLGEVRTKSRPIIGEYLKDVIKGGNGTSKLLEIANIAKTSHKDVVMRQGFRSLSPITIRIKGHDFILDQTGLMLNSFDAKVYKTNIDKIRDTAR